jgi:hypothetical protein
VRHYRHDDRHSQSKPDAKFYSGRADLFGWQFFAAHNFEQRHHRDLGAGGKQHNYNHLYLHAQLRAVRDNCHDDRCGESKPDAELSLKSLRSVREAASRCQPTSNNGIAGSWAPAVNNTTTTTYTFTPNSGQCATTTTMTVVVNPNLTPSFAQVAPICSGGSFTMPTTSNNGIAGSWAPAVNNTATTTYTFTPNSGQCATTATMTVWSIQM